VGFPPLPVARADDRRARAASASLYDRVLFGRQTILVAVALLCVVLRDRIRDPLAVSAVLVAAGIVNVLHHLLHRQGRFARAFEISQPWVDVGAVSYLVAVTGGSASPFVPLYLAGILASAAPLSYAAPWLAVASSTLGYALALRAVGEHPSSASAAHLVMLVGAGALAWGHVRRVRALLRFRAAAAAHEIKNSAHSARMLLDEARVDANASATRLLDAASAELLGLSAMAQRLYGLTAPSSTRTMRLVTVVDEALTLAGPALRAAGIAVEAEPPARTVWLRADPDALRHGLLNLFLNAAEHGPAGGVVRVRTVAGWREARIEVDSVAAQRAAEVDSVVARLSAAVGDGGSDTPSTDVTVSSPSASSRTPCGGWGIGGSVVRALLAPIGARLELTQIEGGLRAAIVVPALTLPWPSRAARPVTPERSDSHPEPMMATRSAQ
jgi:signal transduction histidine kinase